jgi:ABC-type uncharacterized transport system fused permease/ATPase subunit
MTHDSFVFVVIVVAARNSKSGKTAIYSDLVRRLKQIFRIIFPSPWSREMLHLTALSALLVSRTMLSIRVAESTGKVASHLVQGEWEKFVQSVISFSLLGLPAAFVNSFLKFETTMLSLCFRDRLTRHINAEYVRGVNFYKATNLPQVRHTIRMRAHAGGLICATATHIRLRHIIVHVLHCDWCAVPH